MPLKLVEGLNGANGFKNSSNEWIYIYTNGSSLTVKDASGNVTKQSTSPCWLPPGFTISSGTSTDLWLGLQGELPEFAGFLSRFGTGAAATFSLVNGGSTLAVGLQAGQNNLAVKSTMSAAIGSGPNVLAVSSAVTVV